MWLVMSLQKIGFETAEARLAQGTGPWDFVRSVNLKF